MVETNDNSPGLLDYSIGSNDASPSDLVTEDDTSLPGALDLSPKNLPEDFNLSQPEYDFTQRVFPLDLGDASSYNGHYMIININVQTSTQMRQIRYNNTDYSISSILSGELSKTDTLRYNIDGSFGFSQREGVATVPVPIYGDVNIPTTRQRFTRRIKESIALYMPNSELTFTDGHDFQNISLTRFGAMAAAAGGKFVAGGVGTIFGGASGGALAAAAGGALFDGLGNFIGNTSQVLGTPLNPKIEVLYSNTAQRQFAFDFMFSPSNEKESKAIDEIVKTIRFHAAPELRAGSLGIGSFFWIPPSEFDITFYNRGVENTKIPRINTCVLEQIDVSYAPQNVYSTHTNGYPTFIRMMLRFRETEVAHKLRILQGF